MYRTGSTLHRSPSRKGVVYRPCGSSRAPGGLSHLPGADDLVRSLPPCRAAERELLRRKLELALERFSIPSPIPFPEPSRKPSGKPSWSLRESHRRSLRHAGPPRRNPMQAPRKGLRAPSEGASRTLGRGFQNRSGWLEDAVLPTARHRTPSAAGSYLAPGVQPGHVRETVGSPNSRPHRSQRRKNRSAGRRSPSSRPS